MLGNFFALSPVQLLWADPKKLQERSPLGGGPALSLRKAYSAEARKSAEFLTSFATSTNLAGLGADESAQRSWLMALNPPLN